MYEGDHRDGYIERHAGCSSGFTLLELMITVAVAAVLMTVAIPAYQSMVQRNTMTSVVNSLVGAINYARSEAITRGTRVYICASSDQAKCVGDWLDGWIVYAPDFPNTDPTDDNLLRVHGAVTVPRIKITNPLTDTLSFDGTGFLHGTNNDTLTLGTEDSKDETCVIINKSGRVQTETGYFGGSSGSC